MKKLMIFTTLRLSLVAFVLIIDTRWKRIGSTLTIQITATCAQKLMNKIEKKMMNIKYCSKIY